MNSLSILVVDDEIKQRETLADILRDQGCQVETASNLSEAIQIVNSSSLDIILTDFKMPGGTGLELLKKSREIRPQILSIMMTAYADVQNVIEAFRGGAVDYLLKPINVDLLLKKISILAERKDLRDEIARLRAELDETRDQGTLLGESKVMNEVRELIKQVAQTKGTVLITGESGTGKEIAARMVHQLSPLHEKKFVAVNCGAIPENLLESELFGHKKGSFTGAVSDKEGLFSVARGGTLFLDEIGELPKSLQVKLLRVLQEKEILPVGATTPQKIDVRLITATNKDLIKEIEAERFRQDLFYRINVVEVKMPPLRERKEDIPSLCHHLIKKLHAGLGRDAKPLSKEALQCLMNYSWPGNVRELENVIERALIISQSNPTIEIVHLPSGIQTLAKEQSETFDLDQAVSAFSKQHISKVLDSVGGDKKQAAKLLGVGLSSLYRKLEELGVSVGDKS